MITYPELNLARFVKRRVDKTLRVSPSATWKYIHTSQNPADVGTRDTAYKKPEFVKLWLGGPEFLAQRYVDVVALVCAPAVCMTLLKEKSRENCENGLVKIIESVNNLYTLKKRFAYLLAFIEYLVAKSRKALFVRPALDAAYLDRALVKAVKYVQSRCFGAAIDLLSRKSPDDFESFLKRWTNNANNSDERHRVNELKSLRSLRPCVGGDGLLRVEGRLENADLPTDTKHPIILPDRHPLTRLVVLNEHSTCGYAGPSYTLMKTRQRFWIIHGIESVKYYLASCGKCLIYKAKPVRQLMGDLPSAALL